MVFLLITISSVNVSYVMAPYIIELMNIGLSTQAAPNLNFVNGDWEGKKGKGQGPRAIGRDAAYTHSTAGD